MPDHMNIDLICKDLMTTFPDIVSVHELHIWQLTEDKIISTAHIIFLNPQVKHKLNFFKVLYIFIEEIIYFNCVDDLFIGLFEN